MEARLVRDYACLCDRPRKGFNNEDDTGNPSLNTSHRAVTVAYPVEIVVFDSGSTAYANTVVPIEILSGSS